MSVALTTDNAWCVGRSVSDVDKSLAIGLATALMSIFAFIPAPILFGAVVDQTCLIWEEKPCGGKGNCLFYDTDKLRVYLHTAVISEWLQSGRDPR